MVDRAWERDAADSAPSAPAEPSFGYPTGGNPAQGIPATRPGDYWYHMVTEELRAVAEIAGIEPDHADLTQVREAIRRLTGTQVQELTSSTELGREHAGVVLVDASAGSLTLTLPGAGVLAGLRYKIMRTDTDGSRSVTIEPATGDTIAGDTTFELVPGAQIELTSDGVEEWLRETGNVIPDENTGTPYRIVIVDGALMLEEIE